LDEDRFFLINRGSLEERLDPIFYKPSIRAFVNSLLTSKQFSAKPLHKLVTRIVDGPFGTQLKVDDYREVGVPVIRVSNVRTGEISEDKLVKISPEKHKDIRRSRVLPNDVLLTKAGAILGYSAVFPKHLIEGNITSHSVAITCTDEILPHYLKYIFHSKIGQKQIYRWGNKSTRPELNTQEVKKIIIPVLPKEQQQKIIDTYHAAIAKRKKNEQKAKDLLNNISTYLLTELGITLPQQPLNTIANRIYKTSWQKVTGQRLDPFYNQDYFKQLNNSVTKGKLKTVFLKEIISGGLIKGYLPKSTEKFGNNKVVQINSINEDGSFSLGDVITAKNVFRKNQKLFNKDILVVITGATIGKIGFWENEDEYMLGGDIVKFQTAYKINPYYIFSYLRSKAAQTEIKRSITGATNGHLSPTDVKHILIPIPTNQKEYEMIDKIAERMKAMREDAYKLLADATSEFEKSKKEIQKLITK
jgi:type I restriction enzyme S subunit